MKFTETPLAGAYVVELEPSDDERGFFARAFCREEFAAAGLESHIEQINLSNNLARGTFRGLHWQEPPHTEIKFFRCVRGATFNTIVDMRPDSNTYTEWFGVELSVENHLGLYVPGQFANGYLALTDNAEALYTVSRGYSPGGERGLRVDDPTLGIELPIPATTLSEKDRSWDLL
ncbi:MAG: dTDP-4-dehydrorhamnose 3,5-epimerase family protein [Acidimicrobiales bacterium]